MSHFAHYDKKTGKILGWYNDEIHGIKVPEVLAELNKDKTVKTKAVPAHYDRSKIPTPRIECTEDEWQKHLTNGCNYFNQKTKKFSKKDFRTPAQKIDQKISELYTEYLDSINKDITYKGETYQVSPAITEALVAGSVPQGFYWRTSDNKDIPFTYADLQGLQLAITSRKQTFFTKFQTYKKKLRG